MKRTPIRRKTPMRKRRSRPRRGQVVSPETIREIREQADHRCERCGRWADLEVHHVVERGMGGGRRVDERWNLVAICPSCHRAYHDGRIPRREFVGIVAHREGLFVEDLIERYREMGARIG